jgi:hypothetical protein
VDKGSFLNPKNTNVPLVYKDVKGRWKDKICEIPVSLLDIAPTILGNVGIETPLRLDGQSLEKTLETGKRNLFDHPILAEVWNHLVANPCVSLIFSEGTVHYMVVYTPSSKDVLLFPLEEKCQIRNLYDQKGYVLVSDHGLKCMHEALVSDARWQSYLSSFEVEFQARLKLDDFDKQKFE